VAATWDRKYWIEIVPDKLLGYLVKWMGRIVAVYKTLARARRFVRWFKRSMTALQLAAVVYASDLEHSVDDFVTAAGNGDNGFDPPWIVRDSSTV
jgi:hypothetical protein